MPGPRPDESAPNHPTIRDRAHRVSPTRRRMLQLLGGGLLASALVGCDRLTQSAAPAPGGVDTSNLAPAPDLSLTRFDGGQLTLAEQRGKVVFLNFWASWCAPCKAEMPGFESVWQRYRERGVVFIGANIQDIEADARRFLEQEVTVTYPVGRDDQELAGDTFQVAGLPTSVFITRDGRLGRKWPGALSEKQLEAFLNEYL